MNIGWLNSFSPRFAGGIEPLACVTYGVYTGEQRKVLHLVVSGFGREHDAFEGGSGLNTGSLNKGFIPDLEI